MTMSMLLDQRAKRKEQAAERTAGVAKWVQVAGFALILAIVLIAALLIAGPAGAQQAPNTLDESEIAAGWELLFDGSSLEGWRGFNLEALPDGWQAVDGTLSRVAGGGDIVYGAKQYQDFDLRIDWKVGEAGKSGIFYRAEEHVVNAIFKSAVEMQVLDDEGHYDGGSPYTSAGAVYGLYPAPRGVVRPAGEWNEARVVARGPHVEHWLNGVKVAEYELASPEWAALVAGSKFVQWPEFGTSLRGYIGLQDHGDQVWYRNIRIRELR
jgi:hypothetical protein